MSDETPSGDQINISASKLNISGGATAGVDRSSGKSVTTPREVSVSGPLEFLSYAVKKQPLLVWALGVGGIIAIVAIAAKWHLPPMAIVFGSLGVFVGMFGLVIFSALVRPAAGRRSKPPLISVVAIWGFGLLLIGSGFFTASSVFFDWPVKLRSVIVPPQS